MSETVIDMFRDSRWFVHLIVNYSACNLLKSISGFHLNSDASTFSL